MEPTRVPDPGLVVRPCCTRRQHADVAVPRGLSLNLRCRTTEPKAQEIRLWSRARTRRVCGFTLIEILVVVSVIALLVAILLPSLSRARQQAMVTICKANCKQIGNSIATYQAEFQGYVPVLFNNWTVLGYRSASDYPARTTIPSVAFRNYNLSTLKLRQKTSSSVRPFDPEAKGSNAWTEAMFEEYEAKFMPEHYTCPFARGKRQEYEELGRVQIKGRSFDEYRTGGTHDSFHTFQWEGRVVRRRRVTSILVPTGEFIPPEDDGSLDIFPTNVDGRPKYSVLSWNYQKMSELPYEAPPGFVDWKARAGAGGVLIENKHRKWTTTDAQRQGSASLSEVTVMFCGQGEHLGTRYKIRNRGSHRKGRVGGANAIFADSHVDWVKGMQIGWQ